MNRVRSLVLWIIGGLYFSLFLALAYLLSFIFPLTKIDKFLKIMLRGLFRALFIRVKSVNVPCPEPDKSYIYMVNHVSFLDVALVGAFIPGFVRGIEASWQHNWPVYGPVMRRLGNIPIERENIHASIRVMRRAHSYFSPGKSLIIFPEGGRSATPKMMSFKKLPFLFARQSGLPIIPVGISGMYALNNKNSYRLKPGTVTIEFGQPLPYEQYKKLSVVELRDEVRNRLEEMVRNQV